MHVFRAGWQTSSFILHPLSFRVRRACAARAPVGRRARNLLKTGHLTIVLAALRRFFAGKQDICATRVTQKFVISLKTKALQHLLPGQNLYQTPLPARRTPRDHTPASSRPFPQLEILSNTHAAGTTHVPVADMIISYVSSYSCHERRYSRSPYCRGGLRRSASCPCLSGQLAERCKLERFSYLLN